jgi:beta-glucosidase
VSIDYHEGVEVGYRWFAKTAHNPLYAFGHGLVYTTSTTVTSQSMAATRFAVTNTSDRAGAEVPQL